jgi:dolichyl-phosphate-mannose--protein O-mannosyl transferase
VGHKFTLCKIGDIMNWYILIPFAIAVVALIIWLVMRNQKDEEKFEDQLKQNYPKEKDDAADVDTEEILK